MVAANTRRVSKMTRTLLVLRDAARRLRDYYTALRIPTSPRTSHFLCVTRCTFSGREVTFEYLKPLNVQTERSTVFLARHSCDPGSLERDIVVLVNFARHYGRDVHRFLAESHLASQFLYCGPAYPDCAKPIQLVMEFVDDRTLEASEPTVTERHFESLLAIDRTRYSKLLIFLNCFELGLTPPMRYLFIFVYLFRPYLPRRVVTTARVATETHCRVYRDSEIDSTLARLHLIHGVQRPRDPEF